MPARSAEEKAERQLLAARKKEEREAKKKAKDDEKARADAAEAARKAALSRDNNNNNNNNNAIGGGSSNEDATCWILNLPEVAIRQIWIFLSARELGCVISTCRTWNCALSEARLDYVMDRLRGTHLCPDQTEARAILEASYGGGDTKRVMTRKQKKSQGRGDCDEFIGYARFLEEGVCGHCHLKTGNAKNPIALPNCINGRFASCSPEHSLMRIGGDGTQSGPGGSGAAAWGVGRRGQLGTGHRDDVEHPERLFGSLGYGVRVVQVSAGGGLVRVAHSLFLTDTGRVLSCGNGSYGQLGQGYSGAKQLPDYVKPTYISFFNGMRITCVSAGEIHSAAVNADGDLFTFGDGFLGMLGHADKRPQVSPKQVEKGGLEDECVLSVACGCRHTLVITEEGEVWSMGFGRYGVLGRSFTPYEHDPEANLAGGDLDDDVGFEGAVAAAPRVEDEAAAREIRQQEAVQEHLDMINMTLDDASDQCIPKLIDSLQGIKIVGASAGHRHSILLDDTGGIYTCGSGVTGALGHGDNCSHMYPMKVMEFGESVNKITDRLSNTVTPPSTTNTLSPRSE